MCLGGVWKISKKEKFVQLALICKERLLGAEVITISAVIAYYFLLALFPMLIAAGSVLSMLDIDPTLAFAYTNIAVPDALQATLNSIIEDLLTSGDGGLLSISLIGFIWPASRSLRYLQKGMNKAYGIPYTGRFFARRLVSLITIILILLVLIAFVTLFSLGDLILTSLAPTFTWASTFLWWISGLKWPVTALFLFVLMVIVYGVTPDVKTRISNLIPGAAFSTLALLALAQGFTVYLRFFLRSYSSYGTLGTFFLLMVWLHFSSIIVMLGAVLNASIREYKIGKAVATTSRVDRVVEKTTGPITTRLKSFTNDITPEDN